MKAQIQIEKIPSKSTTFSFNEIQSRPGIYRAREGHDDYRFVVVSNSRFESAVLFVWKDKVEVANSKVWEFQTFERAEEKITIILGGE